MARDFGQKDAASLSGMIANVMKAFEEDVTALELQRDCLVTSQRRYTTETQPHADLHTRAKNYTRKAETYDK